MAYNEPGSLPPVPPVPPPLGAPRTPVQPQQPFNPPTRSFNPPLQPPAYVPPSQPFGGPPPEPLYASPPPPPPPEPAPKKSRRVFSLLVAGLLTVGLLAGGIAIGRSLNNSTTATITDAASAADDPVDADSPANEQPGVAEEAVGNSDAENSDAETSDAENVIDEIEPTAVAAVPAPVSEVDDSEYADEPVAQVAAAVAPSVVLLENGIGQGSGIIYDDDGVIVTNAHVVGDVTEVSVMLPSGVRVKGEVVGRDTKTDIAVVKIDPTNEFTPATFAPDASVQVGQLAVAIGSPFGLEQTVTAGIISAINRPVRADLQGETTAMHQTDAPINPGNSGGALADRQGRVVGMNTLIRTDGSAGNIGVGFAIPADTMRFVADRLVAGEPVQSSYLGIQGSDALAGDPGAVVTEVLPETPAEGAGIAPGDRIVQFDGTTITSMSGLAAEVRLTQTDVPVVVTVIRDGAELDFELQLTTR